MCNLNLYNDVFNLIYSIMEFSIRRHKKINHPLIRIRKQRETQTIPIQVNENNERVVPVSLNVSLLSTDHDIQATILDETLRAKASMLLSLPISAQASPKSKSRQSKLSLMYSPKKRVTLTDLTEAFRNRKKKVVNKFSQFRTPRQNSKIGNLEKQTAEVTQLGSFLKTTVVINDSENKQKGSKRLPMSLYSLAQYFQLVFSKILSQPGKQKYYVLIEELSRRYEKLPQTIVQDVADIRNIAQKLKSALGPKETYIQLRPFEALQVNGQFARLIFHLTHEIAAKKYHCYDLTKIYKEIEYCSRKLQFHNFTLKICFQLGELYKQKSDELNSHAYFSKALKLSIFLNDKFHEEKAIDCFGLAAYSSNKSGQAHYFHQNYSKLNLNQRENIHQKYSNIQEIYKISKQRQALRIKNTSNTQRLHSILHKRDRKKEAFNFCGQQFSENYDLGNKRVFKQKINKYIQCPLMRTQILVAKDHMNRIQKIGQITRYKNFETPRIFQRFNEDLQSSSEVLLTHRSLNRKNPEYETRIVQRERKLLLQLINYYTNQIIRSDT